MNLQSEFPDRLLTLSDGRLGLRGTLHIEARQPEPEPAGAPSTLDTPRSSTVLDFVSSDETLDRCDEIILADGWRLEPYRRNPVFQNAHQYGDILFTLGKALITEVRTRPALRAAQEEASALEPRPIGIGRSYLEPREAAESPSILGSQPSSYLFQRIQFATDANPMARIAYNLYKGKFLNAVSVGFIPLRWENGDGAESATHGKPSAASFRRRYREQELLEVSAVAIPANPNALARAVKAGAVEISDLRDLAALTQHALRDTERAHANPPLLLTLARELRNLLKRA